MPLINFKVILELKLQFKNKKKKIIREKTSKYQNKRKIMKKIYKKVERTLAIA